VITALLGLLAMPMAGGVDGVTLVTACTNDGTQTIAVEGDGQSVPVPQAPHKSPCPFCLAHAVFALASSQQVMPMPDTKGVMLRPIFPVGVTPRVLFLVGRQSRAPPFRTV